MSREVPGAAWPRFCFQVQEIEKKKGHADNRCLDRWAPPTKHQQAVASSINKSVWYCDANTIKACGMLTAAWIPLQTYSLYHDRSAIFVANCDVLVGQGALGPVSPSDINVGRATDQAWKHINFRHRGQDDRSSFVGISGEQTFMKWHDTRAHWAGRLIPSIYYPVESTTHGAAVGGLDGDIQILLGLIRLSELPRTATFTDVDTYMRNGKWHMPPAPSPRPHRRGLVVRVWTTAGERATVERFSDERTPRIFA